MRVAIWRSEAEHSESADEAALAIAQLRRRPLAELPFGQLVTTPRHSFEPFPEVPEAEPSLYFFCPDGHHLEPAGGILRLFAPGSQHNGLTADEALKRAANRQDSLRPDNAEMLDGPRLTLPLWRTDFRAGSLTGLVFTWDRLEPDGLPLGVELGSACPVMIRTPENVRLVER